MLKGGVLAFLLLVWVVGIFLGASYEKKTGVDWPGSEGSEGQTTLNYLMSAKNATHQHSLFGSIEMPLPNPEYFKTWLRVMTMQFEFMDGGWQIVQWLVLLPLAAAAIFVILFAMTQLLQGFIPFT